MDMQIITQFFMWCSIINFSMMMFTFLIILYAGDWAYSLHSKWFPMPRETFNTILFSFLGLFKLLFFMFNLVPYLALLIIR